MYAIENELFELSVLRDHHRTARRSITELWFVAAGLTVVIVARGGWLWVGLPLAAYLAYSALRLSVHHPRQRGHDLDEAFDDAAVRLRAQREETK